MRLEKLRSCILKVVQSNLLTSDTISTEMTVHRMVFDELSSHEFFLGGGGTIPSNWLG